MSSIMDFICLIEEDKEMHVVEGLVSGISIVWTIAETFPNIPFFLMSFNQLIFLSSNTRATMSGLSHAFCSSLMIFAPGWGGTSKGGYPEFLAMRIAVMFKKNIWFSEFTTDGHGVLKSLVHATFTTEKEEGRMIRLPCYLQIQVMS